MELNGALGFEKTYQALTLALNFKFSRHYSLAGRNLRDYFMTDGATAFLGNIVEDKASVRGVSEAVNYTVRFMYIEEELCGLSEGACGFEKVRLSQAEAQSQYRQESVLDEPLIDEMANPAIQ